MALPGKTTGEQLAHLETILPHRSANGHLYESASDRTEPRNRALMYLYMVSSDNTYTVHETEFQSKESRTPAEWAAWFKRHAFKGNKKEGKPYETLGIIKGAIIPGVNLKTQLQWRVSSYLGFATYNAVQKSMAAAAHPKRHKAKSSRKQNGQTNIRRRHRNSRRKAK